MSKVKNMHYLDNIRDQLIYKFKGASQTAGYSDNIMYSWSANWE